MNDLLELLQILELYCKKGGYILPPETCRLFCRLVSEKALDPAFWEKFSNGRYVRNIFEMMIVAQSSRLSQINYSGAADRTLNELLPADLQALVDSGDFDLIY